MHMQGALDESERGFGAASLGHLSQALVIPAPEPQRRHGPLAQLSDSRTCHVVVLEQVDDEPLGGCLYSSNTHHDLLTPHVRKPNISSSALGSVV
jgi:hypothetical protein